MFEGQLRGGWVQVVILVGGHIVVGAFLEDFCWWVLFVFEEGFVERFAEDLVACPIMPASLG